jgi:hypothetical protein
MAKDEKYASRSGIYNPFRDEQPVWQNRVPDPHLLLVCNRRPRVTWPDADNLFPYDRFGKFITHISGDSQLFLLFSFSRTPGLAPETVQVPQIVGGNIILDNPAVMCFFDKRWKAHSTEGRTM